MPKVHSKDGLALEKDIFSINWLLIFNVYIFIIIQKYLKSRQLNFAL